MLGLFQVFKSLECFSIAVFLLFNNCERFWSLIRHSYLKFTLESLKDREYYISHMYPEYLQAIQPFEGNLFDIHMK